MPGRPAAQKKPVLHTWTFTDNGSPQQSLKIHVAEAFRTRKMSQNQKNLFIPEVLLPVTYSLQKTVVL